ncbi:HhH-GPD-type base excision DNA repair protein [soil metagenome]
MRRGGTVSDMAAGTLYITGDDAADALLNTDANALLIGMLLDQQVSMELAFAGPAKLRDRLGHLDPARIASMDVDDFVVVCAEKPAIHRFPSSMGKRIHELCTVLAERYGGDAAAIWSGVDHGGELYDRLRALPGFGDEKSRIFVAVLAKTQGVRPAGWQDAAGVFGDDTPRSVADIDGPEALGKVREWKKAQKAAKKDKQGRATT